MNSTQNIQTVNIETVIPDPDVTLLAEAGIEATVIWEGSAGDCTWAAHEEQGVPSAA